jgi:predicted enzyme related to lactoylglutathione lyase
MSGEPTHIELGVKDAHRARLFYRRLLGWEPSGSEGGGAVATPTLGVGIHGEDELSHFEVFFAVDDLDTSLATVRELGGAVNSAIVESSGFGRWAECSDDQGVHFGLVQRPKGGGHG